MQILCQSWYWPMTWIPPIMMAYLCVKFESDWNGLYKPAKSFSAHKVSQAGGKRWMIIDTVTPNQQEPLKVGFTLAIRAINCWPWPIKDMHTRIQEFFVRGGGGATFRTILTSKKKMLKREKGRGMELQYLFCFNIVEMYFFPLK